MESPIQRAVKNNTLVDKIFFDLETTGLGRGKYGVLTNPVGIWQLGVSTSKGSGSLFAHTSVPFEKGALSLFDSIQEGVPSVYSAATKISEKDVLARFGALLVNNPNAVLSGYNIKSFDIPLLAKKFKDYGMQKELNVLANMQVDDVLDKSYSFLNDILSDDAKQVLGLDFENNVKAGAKLEVMAEALGIDLAAAPGGKGYLPHNAEHDVWLTQQLNDVLSDPVEAERSYNVWSHAWAVDRANGVPEDRGLAVRKDASGFHSWSAALKKREAQGPVQWTKNIERTKKYETVKVKDLVNSKGRPLFKQGSPEVKKGKKSVLNEIASEAKDGLNNALKSGKLGTHKDKVVQEAKRIAKSPSTKKGIKFAAAIGGAYLGYLGVKKLLEKDLPKDQYISASVLGKDKEELNKIVLNSKNVQAFNRKMDNSDSTAEMTRMKIGDQLHAAVEEELSASIGSDSEVEVYDKELGIKGSIDVLATINGKKVPIELKSTTTESLETMSEPEAAHASQVNFYAHTQDAPGGYVMYVSKDDTTKRRSFYVPYSPGKLIRDVADFREAVIDNRSKPGVLSAWAHQMDQFFDNSATMPPNYDMNMGTSRSKIRDQSTRTSHMFPGGTPNQGGNTYTGSRYMPRNEG